MNYTQQELSEFIKKEINDYKCDIQLDNLLEDDLGITGDDASELIHAFSKKFNVDISNFIFSNYFYDEPSAFSNFSGRKKPITVNHLLKAIQEGKLDEEILNTED
mgnify:CR=1 FL=1